MASTPRSTIEDSYASGKHCAICGAAALQVGHVAKLPDYVTCRECGSAFLVEEGGERVFYGQIAAGYADAEKFALRQWAFAEAIENRARPDRPTLPDFEEAAEAVEEPAPEPEPEPEPQAEIQPEPEPEMPAADERPTQPYIEFEASAVEAETLEEARPAESMPQEPEAEPGSEFDFLAEIAAEGPAPEPFEEFEAAPAEVEGEDDLDFLADLAAEAPAPDLEEAPVPGKDNVEEDFLLGLMAGQQAAEAFEIEEKTPAEPEPEAFAFEPESEVDFLAGLEAVEPVEEAAPGLVDGDEPHPADTLTPPPWAARPPEAQEPAAEAPSPVAWHELTETEEAEAEPEPEVTLETPREPEVVPASDELSFESEDDPLGLAAAFEALTPDSGGHEAEEEAESAAETPAWMRSEDEESSPAEEAPQVPSWTAFEGEETAAEAAPEVPAWTQFEDEESAAEEPEEFDAFASLRMESESIHEAAEPEEPAVEAEGSEETFEPFEFNQRLGAFGVAEEDEEVEGAAEEEEDFLSGLRRSAAVPLESEPVADTPLSAVRLESQPVSGAADVAPDEEPGEDPLAMAVRMGAITAGAAEETMPEWMQEAEEEEEPEPKEVRGAFHLRDTDPPPGQRYRVVLLGDRVIFPGGDCAHCGRTPVKGRLAVYGTLPNGQKVGQRKVTSFNVPLCGECRERAALQTEEASNARLQAHLISAIIGMVLVVLALVIGLVDARALGVADFMILAILLIVGYAGPVMFLLNRAGNYPPPPDAVYVRTTLLVPSETQGLETAFEWRSKEYAERFFEANQANAIGRLTAVKDRLAPVG